MKTSYSSHKKCTIITIAILFMVIAGTSWLGYVDPSIVEAYGLPAGAFQYNWVFFAIVLPMVLGSMVIVIRTHSITERHKCAWIVCMALLFPFATFALLGRVIWHGLIGKAK